MTDTLTGPNLAESRRDNTASDMGAFSFSEEQQAMISQAKGAIVAAERLLARRTQLADVQPMDDVEMHEAILMGIQGNINDSTRVITRSGEEIAIGLATLGQSVGEFVLGYGKYSFIEPSNPNIPTTLVALPVTETDPHTYFGFDTPPVGMSSATVDAYAALAVDVLVEVEMLGEQKIETS